MSCTLRVEMMSGKRSAEVANIRESAKDEPSRKGRIEEESEDDTLPLPGYPAAEDVPPNTESESPVAFPDYDPDLWPRGFQPENVKPKVKPI